MLYLWGRAEVHTGFVVGRPDGKRSLGRPRLRWYDDVRCGMGEHGLD